MKGENRKTVMNSSDKELTSCKKQKGESRGTKERESKKRMNRITELMIARMTRQTTEMRKRKKKKKLFWVTVHIRLCLLSACQDAFRSPFCGSDALPD